MNCLTFVCIFLAGSSWERAHLTGKKKYYFFATAYVILSAIFSVQS